MKRAVRSEQCEASSAKQANEASEVANGEVSGLILMSVFLVVPDHSALFSVTCPGAMVFLLAPFPLALPFPLLCTLGQDGNKRPIPPREASLSGGVDELAETEGLVCAVDAVVPESNHLTKNKRY